MTRRLDPWAVMLLGILVALGIIILLATPGPWHRVVPSTPRVQVGPAPPTDLAVFVYGTGSGRTCTAAVWVHLGYELPSVTAVVLPVRLTCRLPEAGMQPLDEIVDSAGPAAATDALAEALGVAFDGFLAVGQPSLREAFPSGSSGGSLSGRLRLRVLTHTWGRQQEPERACAAQLRFLQNVGRTWRGQGLNRMALTNYVLGARDAFTDLKLQAVTAVTQCLAQTPRQRIVVGALPAVVYADAAYERWLPEPRALLAYRASFAVDAMPPAYRPAVDERTTSDSIVVLVEHRDAATKTFAAALGARLDDYVGHHLVVETLVCARSDRLTVTLQRRLRRRPPLAAVVAFGQAGARLDDGDPLVALTRVALGEVRAAGLPAVVSVPEVPNRVSEQEAAALTGVAQAEGFPYAVASGTGGSSGSSGSPADPARTSGWLIAESLVRAVQPEFFSPRLPATRLGVDYYQRGRLDVAVLGTDGQAPPGLLDRLRAMGYRPKLVEGDQAGGEGSLRVRFAGDHRLEALCVAGDLGLARDVATPSGDLPAAVTLGAGGR